MEVNWKLLGGELVVILVAIVLVVLAFNFFLRHDVQHTTIIQTPTSENTSGRFVPPQEQEPTRVDVVEVPTIPPFLVDNEEEGVYLRLRNLSYEPRSGFAKIRGIKFDVENKRNTTINPLLSVYVFDENDETFQRTFERARIPLAEHSPGEFTEWTATTDISINEIDLDKTVRLVVVENAQLGSRAYVSIDYITNISEELLN